MCDTCGCNGPVMHTHHHDGAHAHEHTHDHTHEHSHDSKGNRKTISVGQEVLAKNNAFAEKNRSLLSEKKIYAMNIISSPGSGKTTLLEALGEHFGQSMAVIEGDIQTARDAERVIRAGSRAFQITTNGACHLDAHAVGHALDHIDLEGVRLLVIENVGNLVCPATYDLGEHAKVALLSLPEGDDKILKYPALFARAQALIFSKYDLREVVDFDVRKAVNECRSLNRAFETFSLSAKTGEGLETFLAWLDTKVADKGRC